LCLWPTLTFPSFQLRFPPQMKSNAPTKYQLHNLRQVDFSLVSHPLLTTSFQVLSPLKGLPSLPLTICFKAQIPGFSRVFTDCSFSSSFMPPTPFSISHSSSRVDGGSFGAPRWPTLSHTLLLRSLPLSFCLPSPSPAQPLGNAPLGSSEYFCPFSPPLFSFSPFSFPGGWGIFPHKVLAKHIIAPPLHFLGHFSPFGSSFWLFLSQSQFAVPFPPPVFFFSPHSGAHFRDCV